MSSIEKKFESFLFGSRWLLAPFYLGLVTGVVILLYKFFKELVVTVGALNGMDGGAIIISILTLIDISLVANLLLIIIFSGYESCVSKFDLDESHERLAWMGKVGFSSLKLKVLGSIVAISAIELLKLFLSVEDYLSEHGPEHTQQVMIWKVTIHIVFLFSGALFAFMDKVSKAKA